MEQILTSFLLKYCDPNRPVLLALSGGPDSLALYYLLLRFREKYPLKLGIAHVDHGWRGESAEEARIIQEEVLSKGFPFHLKRLSVNKTAPNLEALGREKRLEFFKELSSKYDYQAVLVAHHADDQSETVLKRVLEGTSLPFLGGLKEVAKIKGLILWRPLLSISKKEIGKWLQKYPWRGFLDQTNFDSKFLRGRFRSKILPSLSQEFGKEVGTSLERLGRESLELQEYLDKILESHFKQIERSLGGLYLDLSDLCPNEPLELKYLIRKFCAAEELFLPRSLLETSAQLVREKLANKQIQVGKKILFLDRGRLFIPHPIAEWPLERERLLPGSCQIGSWKVHISKVDKGEELFKIGWKRVWEGSFEVFLPEGNYEWGKAKLREFYPGNSPLSKCWTDAKVPAFLRKWVPVIWKNEKIFFEFVSGKSFKNGDLKGGALKIQFLRLPC